MNTLSESVVTVMVAIIGLASLAVLVSRNARTSEVISATGKSFNSALATAISPVTGAGGFGMGNGGFSPSGSIY